MFSTHRCSLLSLLFALVLTQHTQAAKPEWPEFRGPSGNGVANVQGLPTTWSETENIAWKTALPGKGHSSPVIAGNQIWVTTAVDEPLSEDERKKRLKDNTGDQPLVVSGKLTMRAICIDRRTGELLHDVELMTDSEPQPTHAMNNYASPTPVLEEGRLYCHFGTHGTACVDTSTAKVLWTNREHKIKHENGAGSSPVVVGELVIFHCDGSDLQYITALNKADGQTAWKTPRSGAMNSNPQLKKAYGTPVVLQINGKSQLVSPAADWLYVYDPLTGKELSKMNYGMLGFSIVPRPVVGHGMVYMCTSFMQSQLLAVKYDGSGEPTIAWKFAKQAPSMPSPLLVGDEIYIISDKGIATCLDAKTGDVHWTERLAGNYCASPLFADGKLYFWNREGEATILKPGTKFEKLGANKLDGSFMASPAAVEGALYVRTDKGLYRIGK